MVRNPTRRISQTLHEQIRDIQTRAESNGVDIPYVDACDALAESIKTKRPIIQIMPRKRKKRSLWDEY